MVDKSVVIKLTGAILSFPFVSKKDRYGRYSAAFLLDYSNKAHKKAIAAIFAEEDRLITEKWKGKAPKKLEFCYGDADDEEREYDGYAGRFFISSNSQKRVPLVDGRKEVIEDEDEADDMFYGGAIVNANLHLWAQDNEGGKRINAQLRAIQFVKHGEAFGDSKVDPDQEFDDLEDDEDEANIPKSRKKTARRDEEEEEEAPRKRASRRNEDDEEEEAPRRKKPARSRREETEDEFE